MFLGLFLGFGGFFTVNLPWARASEALNQAPLYRQNAATANDEAQLLLKQGRVPEAIKVYQKAIARNAYSAYTATLYHNLAKAYQQQGQWELALVSYQYALRLGPPNWVSYQQLMGAWQDSGRLLLAQQQLQNVTRLNPTDAEAWLLLGFCYERLGNSAGQRQAWQQVVALEPTSPFLSELCPKAGCNAQAIQNSNTLPVNPLGWSTE